FRVGDAVAPKSDVVIPVSEQLMKKAKSVFHFCRESKFYVLSVVGFNIVIRNLIGVDNFVEVRQPGGVGGIELLKEFLRKILIGYPGCKNKRKTGEFFPMFGQIVNERKYRRVAQCAVTDDDACRGAFNS